jgi:D-beta-D-heptose 7-phosphate kinase/D-beta-D-heptose 1-phosphate adenosyltransferase
MNICVIGDFITDIYVFGEVSKISPESPIPIFNKLVQQTRSGGAGNVASNLKSLGSDVVTYGSHNSTKYRYVTNNHILFRMDEESYVPNNFKPDYNLKDVKYVILSDYNKGFLHKSQEVIDYCKSKDCIVIVDPKKSIENYKNADIVKLNEKELKQYCVGYTSNDEILYKNNIGSMIVTTGQQGAYIISPGRITNIEADQHQVSDVTGAGDIFIAVLTHFLSKGNDIEQAAKKAVKLASISVTKFGTYVLQPEDIKKAYTIFTNGCFDILHKGHVEYLKQSKQLGDKLIVGLNSDASVKKLKGNDRPINNQQDRKAVLESLDCVDEVIIFDQDTPYDLIKQIQPDIITKGGDYNFDTVVGNDLAQVIIIPLIEGYSTSKILEKTVG